MKINPAIFALAIGAFSIGTTEFSPMGLLPNIAASLNIDIPTAGILITGYALGVMFGAPFMTIWFNHLQRRKALVLLMVLFTAGNIFAALSPNYYTLLFSRLITSLSHGAFFGIGSVVATSVVPKNKQASAIASMFMGLTIANIGGVPFATWLGQHIGWRVSFLAISTLGVLTMFFVARTIPATLIGSSTQVRTELKVLCRLPVVFALLTTVLGAGSMFSLYTYIAPSLENITHASADFVTFSLVLIGIGFSIGNYLGGYFADLSLNKTLYAFFLLLAILMVLFPTLAQYETGAVVSLVLWGILAFGVVPALQMRVMQVASEAKGLASSMNIGAFNLGNGLGAALGSFVLHYGLGYNFVSYVGALLAIVALSVVFLQTKIKIS